MAMCIPAAGELTAIATAISTATAASTTATVGSEEKIAATQESGKIMRFIKQTAEWVNARTERLRENMKKMSLKIAQFNKFMVLMARFWPVIKVFIILIIIFSNALQYVIVAIAYVAIAIIIVIYKIIDTTYVLKYIIFFIFYLVVYGIPFLLYSMVFLSLLVVATVICILLAGVDLMTGGMLKSLVLCQNIPSKWYEIPNYHLRNYYSRGLFCSKPCASRYVPDPTGTSCIRIPKQQPSYCPQAQFMRYYTGFSNIRKDKKYMYDDYRVKGNLAYLSKLPYIRESILLDDFLNKQKHLDACNNTTNKFGMSTYNNMLKVLCTNLDVIDRMTDLGSFDSKIIDRLRQVCNQGFCDSSKTYPFCSVKTGTITTDITDLVKKIISAIIGIIVFLVMIMYINHEVSVFTAMT